MEHNTKTINLNESQLNQLISESILEVINEGRFKDMAKKVGKGVGIAALAAAMGGAAYKGLDNDAQYQEKLNNDTRMMNIGNEDNIQKYLNDKGLEDTPLNRREAAEYFEGVSNDYFKNQPMGESRTRKYPVSEAKLAKALRHAIRKTLG